MAKNTLMGKKEALPWWGYLHVDGSLHVKRYFDQRDLDDAYESDFVYQVCQPLLAISREDAVAQIGEILGVTV